MNNAEIEKLQYTVSNLVEGLSANNMDVEHYYLFEDMIFNKQYDLAVDLLKNGIPGLSNGNQLSLLFIFENALAAHHKLI